MDFQFKGFYAGRMNDPEQAKPVPENKLIAYVLPGVSRDMAKTIRPCKPSREWMDNTPGQFAYRCIPLTSANTMGWEILNPVDVELSWSGMDDGDQIEVKSVRDPFAPGPHFGSGTVTWYLPFLFRTPPEYGLIITGPANQDKQHIVPLDAFVRTDWVPFPFTMNWRITMPKTTVKFAAGDPICRVLPYPLELLNNMELELHDTQEDPAFMRKVKDWEKQRQVDYQNQQKAEQKWAAEGKKPAMKDLWNSQYAKGRGSDAGAIEHQNIWKCNEPVDKRK